MTTLFEPAQAGSLTLKNRIIMDALTRSRTGLDGVPSELHVEYYTQRASASLVVTEGTRTIYVGQAFLGQPRIHTQDQITG